MEVEFDEDQDNQFEENPGYTQGNDEFDPDDFMRNESIFDQCRFDKKAQGEQEDQFDDMFNEQ